MLLFLRIIFISVFIIVGGVVAIRCGLRACTLDVAEYLLLLLRPFLLFGFQTLHFELLILDERVQFYAGFGCHDTAVEALDDIFEGFRDVVPERFLELMPDFQIVAFRFQTYVEDVADDRRNERRGAR